MAPQRTAATSLRVLAFDLGTALNHFGTILEQMSSTRDYDLTTLYREAATVRNVTAGLASQPPSLDRVRLSRAAQHIQAAVRHLTEAFDTRDVAAADRAVKSICRAERLLTRLTIIKTEKCRVSRR